MFSRSIRKFRIKQLRRLPELFEARSLTPDWLSLVFAYVGLRPKLPFSIRLATGGFEFREASDVPTFWQIFLAHLYQVMPTDRLVIDAGANIGAFTLYALLHAPAAHVIAVEPAPDTVQRLRSLVEAHGLHTRCTVLQAALSGEIGTTTIQTSPMSQFRVTGQGGVSVPTVTLDSLIATYGSVDLLKLDTEGAEYETLPAASAATLKCIRRIEMEYHPGGNREALFRHLVQHGFVLESARDDAGAPGYGMAKLSRVQEREAVLVGQANLS